MCELHFLSEYRDFFVVENFYFEELVSRCTLNLLKSFRVGQLLSVSLWRSAGDLIPQWWAYRHERMKKIVNRNLKQARTVTVVMRKSEFYHLKETTHCWRHNAYLIFVFRPPEYFTVSKRTPLNALKSNSLTNNFHRFNSHRCPEYVQTLWVTLYSEQERRWDYS